MSDILPFNQWLQTNAAETDPVNQLKKFAGYVRNEHWKRGTYDSDVERGIENGIESQARELGLFSDDTSEEDRVALRDKFSAPDRSIDSEADFVYDDIRFNPVSEEHPLAAEDRDIISRYVASRNLAKETDDVEAKTQAESFLPEVDRILGNRDVVNRAKRNALTRGDVSAVALEDKDGNRFVAVGPDPDEAVVRSQTDSLINRGAITPEDIPSLSMSFKQSAFGATNAEINRQSEFMGDLQSIAKNDKDLQELLNKDVQSTTLRKKEEIATTGESILNTGLDIIGGAVSAIGGAVMDNFKALKEEGLSALSPADVIERTVGAAQDVIKSESELRRDYRDMLLTTIKNNTALADKYSEAEIDRLTDDYVKLASGPAYRPDKIGSAVDTTSTGIPIVAPEIALRPEAFEDHLAASSLSDTQKEAARQMREKLAEQTAPETIKFLSRMDNEFVDALATSRSEGKSDIDFVQQWLGDEKNYDNFQNRAKAFGLETIKAVASIPTTAMALLGNEQAAKSLVGMNKDAGYGQYAELFGDRFGVFQQLGNLVPSVGVDLLLAAGTGGLATAAKQGASTVARGVARNVAAKAVKKGATNVAIKAFGSAIGKIDDVTAALTTAIQSSNATSKAFTTIANGLRKGAVGAGRFTENLAAVGPSSFLRSAGGTYASVYGELPDTMSHEAKHEASVGYAVTAGLFTATITAGLSALGLGGTEKLATRNLDDLTFNQVRKLYSSTLRASRNVLDKDIKKAIKMQTSGAFKSLVREHVEGFVSEGFEEGLDQAFQIMVDQAAKNKDVPIREIGKGVFDAVILGGLMGASTTALRQVMPTLTEQGKQDDQAKMLRARDELYTSIASRLTAANSPKTAEALANVFAQADADAAAAAAAAATAAAPATDQGIDAATLDPTALPTDTLFERWNPADETKGVLADYDGLKVRHAGIVGLLKSDNEGNMFLEYRERTDKPLDESTGSKKRKNKVTTKTTNSKKANLVRIQLGNGAQLAKDVIERPYTAMRVKQDLPDIKAGSLAVKVGKVWYALPHIDDVTEPPRVVRNNKGEPVGLGFQQVKMVGGDATRDFLMVSFDGPVYDVAKYYGINFSQLERMTAADNTGTQVRQSKEEREKIKAEAKANRAVLVTEEPEQELSPLDLLVQQFRGLDVLTDPDVELEDLSAPELGDLASAIDDVVSTQGVDPEVAKQLIKIQTEVKTLHAEKEEFVAMERAEFQDMDSEKGKMILDNLPSDFSIKSFRQIKVKIDGEEVVAKPISINRNTYKVRVKLPNNKSVSVDIANVDATVFDEVMPVVEAREIVSKYSKSGLKKLDEEELVEIEEVADELLLSNPNNTSLFSWVGKLRTRINEVRNEREAKAAKLAEKETKEPKAAKTVVAAVVAKTTKATESLVEAEVEFDRQSGPLILSSGINAQTGVVSIEAQSTRSGKKYIVEARLIRDKPRWSIVPESETEAGTYEGKLLVNLERSRSLAVNNIGEESVKAIEDALIKGNSGRVEDTESAIDEIEKILEGIKSRSGKAVGALESDIETNPVPEKPAKKRKSKARVKEDIIVEAGRDIANGTNPDEDNDEDQDTEIVPEVVSDASPMTDEEFDELKKLQVAPALRSVIDEEITKNPDYREAIIAWSVDTAKKSFKRGGMSLLNLNSLRDAVSKITADEKNKTTVMVQRNVNPDPSVEEGSKDASTPDAVSKPTVTTVLIGKGMAYKMPDTMTTQLGTEKNALHPLTKRDRDSVDMALSYAASLDKKSVVTLTSKAASELPEVTGVSEKAISEANTTSPIVLIKKGKKLVPHPAFGNAAAIAAAKQSGADVKVLIVSKLQTKFNGEVSIVNELEINKRKVAAGRVLQEAINDVTSSLDQKVFDGNGRPLTLAEFIRRMQSATDGNRASYIQNHRDAFQTAIEEVNSSIAKAVKLMSDLRVAPSQGITSMIDTMAEATNILNREIKVAAPKSDVVSNVDYRTPELRPVFRSEQEKINFEDLVEAGYPVGDLGPYIGKTSTGLTGVKHEAEPLKYLAGKRTYLLERIRERYPVLDWEAANEAAIRKGKEQPFHVHSKAKSLKYTPDPENPRKWVNVPVIVDKNGHAVFTNDPKITAAQLTVLGVIIVPEDFDADVNKSIKTTTNSLGDTIVVSVEDVNGFFIMDEAKGKTTMNLETLTRARKIADVTGGLKAVTGPILNNVALPDSSAPVRNAADYLQRVDAYLVNRITKGNPDRLSEESRQVVSEALTAVIVDLIEFSTSFKLATYAVNSKRFSDKMAKKFRDQSIDEVPLQFFNELKNMSEADLKQTLSIDQIMGLFPMVKSKAELAALLEARYPRLITEKNAQLRGVSRQDNIILNYGTMMALRMSDIAYATGPSPAKVFDNIYTRYRQTYAKSQTGVTNVSYEVLMTTPSGGWSVSEASPSAGVLDDLQSELEMIDDTSSSDVYESMRQMFVETVENSVELKQSLITLGNKFTRNTGLFSQFSANDSAEDISTAVANVINAPKYQGSVRLALTELPNTSDGRRMLALFSMMGWAPNPDSGFRIPTVEEIMATRPNNLDPEAAEEVRNEVRAEIEELTRQKAMMIEGSRAYDEALTEALQSDEGQEVREMFLKQYSIDQNINELKEARNLLMMVRRTDNPMTREWQDEKAKQAEDMLNSKRDAINARRSEIDRNIKRLEGITSGYVSGVIDPRPLLNEALTELSQIDAKINALTVVPKLTQREYTRFQNLKSKFALEVELERKAKREAAKSGTPKEDTIKKLQEARSANSARDRNDLARLNKKLNDNVVYTAKRKQLDDMREQAASKVTTYKRLSNDPAVMQGVNRIKEIDAQIKSLKKKRKAEGRNVIKQLPKRVWSTVKKSPEVFFYERKLKAIAQQEALVKKAQEAIATSTTRNRSARLKTLDKARTKLESLRSTLGQEPEGFSRLREIRSEVLKSNEAKKKVESIKTQIADLEFEKRAVANTSSQKVRSAQKTIDTLKTERESLDRRYRNLRALNEVVGLFRNRSNPDTQQTISDRLTKIENAIELLSDRRANVQSEIVSAIVDGTLDPKTREATPEQIEQEAREAEETARREEELGITQIRQRLPQLEEKVATLGRDVALASQELQSLQREINTTMDALEGEKISRKRAPLEKKRDSLTAEFEAATERYNQLYDEFRESSTLLGRARQAVGGRALRSPSDADMLNAAVNRAANKAEIRNLGLMESPIVALQNIVKSGPPHLRLIAKLILRNQDALDGLRVIVEEFDPRIAGFQMSNIVAINLSGHNGKGVADVLIHEIVHYITRQALLDPDVAARMDQLRELARTRLLAMNENLADFEYALSSNEEFLSAVFTDPRLQEALDVPANGAPRSLFQKILDFILRVFNADNAQTQTAMRELVRFTQESANSMIYGSRADVNREAQTVRFDKQYASRIRNFLDEMSTMMLDTTLADFQDRLGFGEAALASPSVTRDTTQRDAAYIAAVEAGDMETAQRMVDEAARAAGYDTQAYHYTSSESKFYEFDKNMSKDFGGWFFFNPRDINTSGKRDAKRMGKFFLMLGESIERPSYETVAGVGTANSYIENDDVIGVDSIIGTEIGLNGKEVSEILIRNPNQIKSADPVTYDANGNVIPLSQRFNTQSNSILFSPSVTRDTDLESRIRSKVPAGMTLVADTELRGVMAVTSSGVISYNPELLAESIDGYDPEIADQMINVMVTHEVGHEAANRVMTPQDYDDIAAELGREELDKTASLYYSLAYPNLTDREAAMAADRESGDLDDRRIAAEWVRMQIDKAILGKSSEELLSRFVKKPSLIARIVEAIRAFIGAARKRQDTNFSLKIAADISRATREATLLLNGGVMPASPEPQADVEHAAELLGAAVNGSHQILYTMPLHHADKKNQATNTVWDRVKKLATRLPSTVDKLVKDREGRINEARLIVERFAAQYRFYLEKAVKDGADINDVSLILGSTSPLLDEEAEQKVAEKVIAYRASLDSNDPDLVGKVNRYKYAVTQSELKGRDTDFLTRQQAAEARLNAISPEFVKSLKAFRAEIDKRQMAVRVSPLTGIYLTRTYQFFRTEGWAAAARQGGSYRLNGEVIDFDDLREKAAQVYESQIRADFAKRGETLTADRLRDEMFAKLDGLLARLEEEAKSDTGDSIRQDIARSMPKGVINPALRELLGEVTNPFENAVRTFGYVSMLDSNAIALKSIRETLIASGLAFETQRAGYEQVFGKGKSETMAPLAGLYVREDIAKELTAEFSGSAARLLNHTDKVMQSVGRSLSRVSGAAMTAKTLMSVGFYTRNWITNQIVLLAAQGVIPGDPRCRMLHSYRLAWLANFQSLGKEADSEAIADLEKLTRLSILRDSPQRGNFDDIVRGFAERTGATYESVLDDIVRAAQDSDYASMSGIIDKLKAVAGKGVDILASINGLMDDAAKAQLFYFERSELIAAYPDWTEEQLDEEAARKVKMTMPGHSQQLDIVRSFNRNPLALMAFPFARWKTETLRTLVNTYKLGLSEIRSGNPRMVWRGVKRVGCNPIVVVGGPALAGSVLTSLFAALIDDEEEEKKQKSKVVDDPRMVSALRMALPEWQRGHSLSMSTNGRELRVVDMTAMMPYAAVSDSLNLIMEGMRSGKGLDAKGVAAYWKSQFIGSQIAYSAISQLSNNKDDFGNNIYEETDSITATSMKVLGHIYQKAFEPGVAAKFRAVTREGELERDQIFWGEILGARPVAYKLDRVASSGFYNLKEQFDSAKRLRTKLSSGRFISDEDFVDVMTEAQNYEDRIQAQTHRFITAMRFLGYDDRFTALSAKQTGMSRKRFGEALYGINTSWIGNKDWVTNMVLNVEKGGEDDPRRRVELLRSTYEAMPPTVNITNQ